MSPAARPVASSGASGIANAGGRFPSASATELTVASSPSRISSSHLTRIASSLTPADRQMLLFVGETRLATGAQLVRRFWGERNPTTGRASRRQLSRLRDARLLTVLPRSIGGVRAGSAGHVYALDVAGLRVLRDEGIAVRRIQTPSERFVRHTLEITEMVVALHEVAGAGELDLIQVQPEPASWRSFAGAWGARQTAKPDLFCRIGAGAVEDSWFVEVDLGTNSKATELAKLRRYVAHYKSGAEQRERGVYPRVLWACDGDKRESEIRALISGLPEAHQRLFATCELAKVAGYIAAEART